jgi:hypothetical protein
MRLLRWIIPAVLALGLIACGPPRTSVFPPSLSIQQLQVRPNGLWHLTLRIQNNSYGEMDFKAINGELKIADGVPVRVHSGVARDIPALAGDVLELDVLPTPQMASALQAIAAKGSAGTLAYALDGVASAKPEKEDQPRDFDFHGNDWLSPVPGIPNTYR